MTPSIAALQQAPELLPCPFCGGKASIVKRDVEPQGDPWYGRKEETFVLCECGACLFDGSFHEGFYDAETRAVAAWNNRAALSCLRAVVKDTGEVEADTKRLDWLEQNLFHREKDEWDSKRMPDLLMWVLFAPKGVQGSARRIIDAAMSALPPPPKENAALSTSTRTQHEQ